MQIENALINDHLGVAKLSWKFRSSLPVKFAISLKRNLLFSSFYCFFVDKKNFLAQQLKS